MHSGHFCVFVIELVNLRRFLSKDIFFGEEFNIIFNWNPWSCYF